MPRYLFDRDGKKKESIFFSPFLLLRACKADAISFRIFFFIIILEQCGIILDKLVKYF